ncbi:hypothetical protein TanjilG_29922 [Lupinus angustifolius]|uniref:MsrB domain-containing protein n=2 Tax=Lupinus angustifolius TaxID=3871 RepID=A0A1J7HIT4_LUPAN|nr:hypothetical protein TanjilG_29922 [Lupinus angustifolius]
MVKGSCQQLHFSSFIRDVNYSCGSCGYELNLNSSNRNTTSFIDSKCYNKFIKKGFISFFSIDETRFSQLNQLPYSFSWLPFFNSKRQPTTTRRRRRTKLLCLMCGTHLGYGYTLPNPHSQSWDGITESRIYDIKLNALQPSLYDYPSQSSKDMDNGNGMYENDASSISVMNPRIGVM